MKPRLLLIFAIIVLLPAGFITGLGWRVSHEEQHRVKRQLMEVISETLSGTRTTIEGVIGDLESDLFPRLEQASQGGEVNWREMSRDSPWIRQVFVLDAQGELQYPNPNTFEQLTDREKEFLERTRAVWLSGSAFGGSGEDGAADAGGWHSWYWNNGLHLIAWQRNLKTGTVVGAEIERMRLLSEILAKLPDSGPESGISRQARIELHDASDHPLYGWGELALSENAAPLLETKLATPLSAWTLAYFSNLPALQQEFARGSLVNFGWLLVFTVLACVGLAVYFYREYCRDIREASQRVTFVNQVSHELKTPLTNIRMYAELLEAKLDGEDEEERKGIEVIVSESQRLSRLITNVLTFSRSQQNKLKLQPRAGQIDDSIRSALEHFRPTLEQAGFEIEFEPGASKRCAFDADAVEQILTNLIGNVEKYAPDGKWLRVESSMPGPDRCEIRICDRGPGIPAGKEEWIFQPFERLSDKLYDAAGTGIGLNIARNLARLHGGDVVVETKAEGKKPGACFLVTLHVEPA